MKKFAVSLIALAAISTASFAASNPGDGVDTDAPRIFENFAPNSGNAGVSVDALSTGMQPTENYINPAQLR